MRAISISEKLSEGLRCVRSDLNFKQEIIVHGTSLPAVQRAVACLLVALLRSLTSGGAAFAAAGSSVSGVVLDSSGASVSEASVLLLSAQQVTIGAALTP